MTGVHSENITAIYDKSLKKLFNPESNKSEKREAIDTIVEEEVHHQKYKDGETQKGVVKTEGQSIADKLYVGQEIERAAGTKQMVEEIMQELPPLEKLLESFYQRVGRK